MANDCYQYVTFYSPVEDEIHRFKDVMLTIYHKNNWLPDALKEIGVWKTEEDFRHLEREEFVIHTSRGYMMYPPEEIQSKELPDGTTVWYFDLYFCCKWTYIVEAFTILINHYVPGSNIKFVYTAEEPGFNIFDNSDKDHLFYNDTIHVDLGWKMPNNQYHSICENMQYPLGYKDIPKYINSVLENGFGIDTQFVPSMFCKQHNSIEDDFAQYVEDVLGGTIEWYSIQPFNYVD